MAFTVRRLGPPEWPLLRETRLRALADAPHAFGSTFSEEVDRDRDWWVSSAGALAWFAATARSDSEEAAGLVAGMPADHDPDARAVISMWVAPEQRGTSVARDLLDAVERWARAEGATALVLRVSDGNVRARRFYERRGFAPTGHAEPLRSNPSVAAVEMRLALPRARLRFAPSPAGDLHVGHVRTAVLTWMLSRQLSGDYFVRFENTDEAKEIAGSRAAIVADLAWLGLLGSEPPHDQAAMTGTYLAALERLASGGHTYTEGGAVRFRTPSDGTVEWDDLVRGPVTVSNADLGDPVLVRSSGTPTFYLASTVDDAEDAVTHLVRAVPMVRATAAQLHIWRAIGVEPPSAGHVPLVTGPGGAPVRFGSAAATVRALREHGIGRSALLAYLALPETASWKTPPTDLEEIISRINLRRLARRPLTFDQRALETLNRRQP